MEFDWDSENRRHIARHGIAPGEAEEAVLIEPLEADVQQHESEELNMPKKQITIPKFRTEAEEAEWWDSHPEVATEIMKRALTSGKARRPVPLKTVTMRFPLTDLKVAQDLARHKGLPYQTYIKMLLHEALEKERR